MSELKISFKKIIGEIRSVTYCDGIFFHMLKEMRVKQYTKNLLVFAAILFAGEIFHGEKFLCSFMAFISFSCMSSVIYIFNDIIDLEKDKLHPDKCTRPIAAGQIKKTQAIIVMVILAALSLFLAVKLGNGFLYIIGSYVLINLAYSIKLKHVVLVDVMVIALGFVLRALAGVIAIQVDSTSWFILCVFMLALFLALAKRRHELKILEGEEGRQRQVLQFYSVQLIDQFISIVTAMTITSYSLFAAQGYNPGMGGGFPAMMITIPIVVYGMFRYLYLVHIKKMGGKPEDVLLHDHHILGTGMVYVLIIIFIRNL